MSGRFEPFIIAGAIVVVAGSTAVSLWSGAGLAWHYAALAGIVMAAFMIPLALRGKGGGDQVRTLEAKLDKLGRKVHALEQKLSEVDDKMVHYSRSTVRAVASELDAVGAVMRDLAEAVAVHDAELFAPRAADKSDFGGAPAPKAGIERAAFDFGLDASRDRAAVAVPDIPLPVSDLIRRAVQGIQPAKTKAAAQDESRQTSSAPPDAEPLTALEDVAAVERAISTENVELLLQAVVILPQRRVKLYETRTRVRTSAGRMLDHATVTAIAADLNLSSKLDTFVLAHAVKVARHLAQRGREVPVVFSGTRRAFADPAIFQQISAFQQTDQELVGRLLVQAPHAIFREASGRERESLEALNSIGVRFLLDDLADFTIDSRALATRGARFIRIGADVMIAAGEGRLPVEIHPADLAGFLARHGLSLIVDGVSTETIALELQEFGAPLAQGEALAPARVLRLDVLDLPAVPPPTPASERQPEAAPAPATPSEATQEAAAAAKEPASVSPRGTPLRAFLRRTTA